MPTTRRRRARGRPVALTMEQRFELLIGPNPRRSAFPDDDARRQAWADQRDELLDRGPGGRQSYGSRPWAWWHYDSPAPRSSSVRDAPQLYELGLLEGPELAAVQAEWRRTESRARVLAACFPAERAREQYMSCRQSGGVPTDFEVWDAVGDA